MVHVPHPHLSGIDGAIGDGCGTGGFGDGCRTGLGIGGEEGFVHEPFMQTPKGTELHGVKLSLKTGVPHCPFESHETV